MKVSRKISASLHLIYLATTIHATITDKPITSNNEDIFLSTNSSDPEPLQPTKSKKEYTSRIVGGENANEDEFPFMVSWHFNTQSSPPSCGGSLVAPNLVLSAAHCQGISGGVRIGSSYAMGFFAPSNERVEVRNVVRKIVHPNYNNFDNDFMLLELDSKVDTNTFQPINLNFDEQQPSVNDMLTVIGFGATTESGRLSIRLKKVDVPANSYSSCRSQYGNDIEDSIHLCAGYTSGGRDSCQGDSGGPIFEEINGVVTQVGVVSFGEGCARPNRSGVYARVSGAEDWLKSEICSRSQDPKPSYCSNSNSSPSPPPTPSTPPPTPTPTYPPTPSPVTSPTVSPTPFPTYPPTPPPLASPTRTPTPFPTYPPTPPPVASPTFPPTVEPTPSPTPLPTLFPTPSPTRGCTECSDNEDEWMFYQNIDCFTAGDLLETLCNKNDYWINNNICQYSCYLAGNGYSGDSCCEIENYPLPPTPPPTPSPTPLPTRSPNMIVVTDNCIICDDIGNDWMISVGMECPSSYLLETKCNKNEVWTQDKSCRLSCFNAGYGYEGDVCCGPSTEAPVTPPTDSPTIFVDSPVESNDCTDCSDVGNDWMVSVGMPCPSSYLLETKCNKNSAWIENQYCQFSCYNEGYGYEGDVCCGSQTKSRPENQGKKKNSLFELSQVEENTREIRSDNFWL